MVSLATMEGFRRMEAEGWESVDFYVNTPPLERPIPGKCLMRRKTPVKGTQLIAIDYIWIAPDGSAVPLTAMEVLSLPQEIKDAEDYPGDTSG